MRWYQGKLDVELDRGAVRQIDTESCDYDHIPVSRGCMRVLYPLLMASVATPRFPTTQRGSVSALGARRASFLDHSPPVPIFAPTSPNN